MRPEKHLMLMLPLKPMPSQQVKNTFMSPEIHHPLEMLSFELKLHHHLKFRHQKQTNQHQMLDWVGLSLLLCKLLLLLKLAFLSNVIPFS
jgi:hypothetical protein